MSLEKKSYSTIIIISVIVPLLVAYLLFSPEKTGLGEWVKVLPHLHAILNSTCAVVLVVGLVLIKQGNIQAHRAAMSTAFILGALFLISYIIYHSSAGSVKYGDVDGDGVLTELELQAVGGYRTTYIILLLSHIGLSVVVVPLILLAFYYALSNKIDKHKAIVKYTWPIWFYVAVSGVLVYWMISGYYQ
ncbi:MAG: DUF420 domain-containing protein [Cyclobacteriaceae bacterium]